MLRARLSADVRAHLDTSKYRFVAEEMDMAPQRQYEARFFIPIAAILIGMMSGCATSYNVPTSTDRARLRIVVDRPPNKYSTLAGAFANPGCDEGGGGRLAHFSGSPISGGGRKSLGMPGADSIPEHLRHEFELPAGKPFTFIIRERGSTGQVQSIGSTLILGREECAVTASFTPLINEQYEAYYSFNHATGQCIVRLSRLIERDNSVVREPHPMQTFSCKYPGGW